MKPGIYCGERLDDDDRQVEAMVYRHDRHGLIIGPTGCGKSTSFIMSNLLGDQLNGTSQIVIDPKGEVAAVCALKRTRHADVRIIDPFGIMRELEKQHSQLKPLRAAGLIDSAGFNPLAAGLDPASPSFYDDCAAIGEALIKIEGKDPHWPESAQGLLTGLIMWEKIRNRAFANLANVRLMLTEAEREETTVRNGEPVIKLVAGLKYHVRTIVAAHLDTLALEAKGGTGPAPAATLEIAASLVARFLEPTNETRSVVSTADTQTRWLLSPLMQADLGKPGLDFRDLKRKPTCVFVVLPSSRLRTHSIWLRLVIVTALRRLYVAEGTRTLIFVDEMPALGYLPPLVDAFALVRGYNIGLVGVAQDLNQLKALYKDHWESFIANAGYIICWGANDLTTAGWMSKRAGQETHIAPSVSQSDPVTYDPDRGSTSYSESYVARPRYLPQELIGLERGKALIFLAGVSKGFFTRLRHYKQMGFERVQGFNPYSP